MLEDMKPSARNTIWASLIVLLALTLYCTSARAGSTLMRDSYLAADAWRYHRPVPLDSPPVDTSEWPITEPPCSMAGIRAAMSTASPRTIVQPPPFCRIVDPTANGTLLPIGSGRDDLLLRGNPIGGLSIVVNPPGIPPTDGYRVKFAEIGSASSSSLLSWAWTGGYEQGATTLVLGTPDSTLRPGDLIRKRVPSWNDVRADYFHPVRVMAVDGPRITVDRENPIDYTGGLYFFGPLSGHTIELLERGDGSTNRLAERIGFENITIEHAKPYAVDSFNSMFEIPGCVDCWVQGNTLKRWGNSVLDTGSGGNSSTARLSFAHNDVQGEYWRMRCVATVESASGSEVILRVPTGSPCRAWNDGRWSLEPAVWLPEQDIVARYGCIDCNPSDGQITLSLTEMATGDPVTAFGESWVVQLNTFGMAAVYCSGPASEVNIIDNAFLSPRVAFIQQQGCDHPVVFGNYIAGGPHGSRGLFTHGGRGVATVWERNVSNLPYVPYATAPQGHGVGPYWTMFYNSGRSGSAPGCGGGSICIEMTGQDGYSSDYPNYFGNFLTGVRGGVLDSCDHNDDGSANCNTEAPYQLIGMDWKRNLTDTDVSGAFAVGQNRTSNNRDALTSGPSVGRPVEWYLSQARMPSSLTYDRELEKDAFFKPSWWCRESPAFELGLVENRQPGVQQGKLPAQIRAEGGKCTTNWQRLW